MKLKTQRDRSTRSKSKTKKLTRDMSHPSILTGESYKARNRSPRMFTKKHGSKGSESNIVVKNARTESI